MASSFNWVDYILLTILLCSSFSGLLRGGIKEIISLITWIVAFFAAGAFAKPLASHFAAMPSVQSLLSSTSGNMPVIMGGHTPTIVTAVSFLLIFMLVLIVGGLIGTLLSSAAETGGLGIINRLIGGLFGLARGYLINVVIIFVVQLTAIAQQMFWTQSVLVNNYQPAVVWFANFVQPGLTSLKTQMGQVLQTVQP